MKIGISTLTYDPNGAMLLKLDPATELKNDQGGRRVSRTATLDGGASVFDSGYSVADRTYITKSIDNDGSLARWAEYITKTYTQVLLSTRFGLFVAVPSNWWVVGEYIHIQFLIIEER